MPNNNFQWKWVITKSVLILSFLLSIFLIPFSVLFLSVAQTLQGLSFGILTLFIGFFPFVLYIYVQSPKNRLGFFCLVSHIGIIGLLLLFILIRTPHGNQGQQLRATHQFIDHRKFNRFNIFNWVPEIDQLTLGARIIPFIDDRITIDQARLLTIYLKNAYKDMDQSQNFQQLGTALNHCYAEILGWRVNPGHYYLYIPEVLTDKQPPAIVFIHGSLGNFKVYLWFWAKLAEEKGFVIIAPSFGTGNWRTPVGDKHVVQTIEAADKIIPLNRDQIYLSGLSNGGLEVSRLADLYPQRFRGLIYLSPVFDYQILDSNEFVLKWQNKPILVLTGKKDKRIPFKYILERTTFFKNNGVDITERFYASEDHFLFLSQSERVFHDILQWLNRYYH